MNISRETTDDIDLSIHSHGAGMTEAARHGCALTPAAGSRIVLLNELLIVPPSRRAAQHINLSIQQSHRHLAAGFRKACFLRPLSLPTHQLWPRETGGHQARYDHQRDENHKPPHIHPRFAIEENAPILLTCSAVRTR